MPEDNNRDQNSIIKGYNLLLYFAGSMIMYEPVEECIIDFWSKGILKMLPVTSRNPRFIEAAAQLRHSCTDLEQCRNMLQEDFNRLFSNSGSLFAPPNKSYHIPDSHIDDTVHESVSDFYNSYGWKYRTRYNIHDDHLGIELLFLTLLTDKYIAMDDEVCRIEMRNEIRRFIELHILSWLPTWNDMVQENSETLCYQGIATLVYACCEDLYNLMDKFKSQSELPTSFKN